MTSLLFLFKGLARRQYDRVKLHVTAMNTKFLKKEIQEYKKKKETFDASRILKVNFNCFDKDEALDGFKLFSLFLQDHHNTYFGKMNVSSVHLSQRHAKSKDDYYLTTAKIELGCD